MQNNFPMQRSRCISGNGLVCNNGEPGDPRQSPDPPLIDTVNANVDGNDKYKLAVVVKYCERIICFSNMRVRLVIYANRNTVVIINN